MATGSSTCPKRSPDGSSRHDAVSTVESCYEQSLPDHPFLLHKYYGVNSALVAALRVKPPQVVGAVAVVPTYRYFEQLVGCIRDWFKDETDEITGGFTVRDERLLRSDIITQIFRPWTYGCPELLDFTITLKHDRALYAGRELHRSKVVHSLRLDRVSVLNLADPALGFNRHRIATECSRHSLAGCDKPRWRQEGIEAVGFVKWRRW